MAKRKDTDDIYVCIVALTNRHQTEEEATVRKLEMDKAHSLLGVKDSCILTHESGYLDLEPMYELVGHLEEVIRTEDFTEIYIPARCHMHDHSIVNDACIAALRPGNPRPPFIAEYEHNWPGWSSVEGGTGYCVLTKKEVELKLAALECFSSQLGRHKHVPRHPLSSEATLQILEMRGYECGAKYAERFKIMYAEL